jgi:hypothetical protein
VQPNSDDRNAFATSDRPSGGATRGNWLEDQFAPYDPLPALAAQIDFQSLVRTLRTDGRGVRAHRIAAALDPARRELALGWIAVDAQRPRRAEGHFAAALAADPTLSDAAMGLALVDPEAPVAQLPERARVLIEAQRSDDSAVARNNDALLAQWQPGELLYLEAAEQRLRWRIALGEPADLEEAFAIVETVLARISLPRFLVYRAEIAARLERPNVAWLSLHALATDSTGRASPVIAQRALALARSLGEPPSPAIRIGLEQLARGGRGAVVREGP